MANYGWTRPSSFFGRSLLKTTPKKKENSISVQPKAFLLCVVVMTTPDRMIPSSPPPQSNGNGGIFFRYSARGGPFFLLRPIDTRSHVPIECTLDAFSCWPSLRTSQQSFSWRDVICSQLPNQTKEIPSLSLSLSLYTLHYMSDAKSRAGRVCASASSSSIYRGV